MKIQNLLNIPHKSSETFRVTVGSDWAPLPFYQNLMHHDPLAVYGNLLPLLRESDLNVVNVECVLGTAGEPIPKAGPCLRADAEFVSALTSVPFHVATLANNHSMDYGPDSLRETRYLLEKNGMQCVGAGQTGVEASEPLILERRGLRLAILNCGEGEACASLDNGPGAHVLNVPVQVSQIKDLRARADVVIVIVHGGREHAPVPPPYFVKALRSFAEAGADAVIAHHAHVPQGIEFHGGVPIAYSLGNFVFQPQDDLHYTVIGYLAHLDFALNAPPQFFITPYAMRPEGVFRLEGAALEEFVEDMKRVSALLDNADSIRQMWDAFGDVLAMDYLKSCLQGQLDLLPRNPQAAAACLHNLFFAPAHRECYLHNLKRLVHGTSGDSSAQAQECVLEWMQRRIGESPQATLTRCRGAAKSPDQSF